jgi:hypothetical protein
MKDKIEIIEVLWWALWLFVAAGWCAAAVDLVFEFGWCNAIGKLI